MPTRSHFLVSLVMVLLMAAEGCSSSKVTNTWRDPNFAGPIQFKKTVALVMYPDGAVRREAEDELVRQIGPDRAVAAHAILSEEDRNDIDKLKAKLQANGVDGAVTMKVIGAKTQTTYVPGSAGYGGFYDYYGSAYRGGSPGMLVTDRIVSVQTNIYSVREGKMIWSGTSDSFDASNIQKMIGDIAKAIGTELRKEKLIQ